MVNISSRITSAQAIQKSLNLKTKAAISLTDDNFGLLKKYILFHKSVERTNNKWWWEKNLGRSIQTAKGKQFLEVQLDKSLATNLETLTFI